jgi:hypothetical protein
MSRREVWFWTLAVVGAYDVGYAMGARAAHPNAWWVLPLIHVIQLGVVMPLAWLLFRDASSESGDA